MGSKFEISKQMDAMVDEVWHAIKMVDDRPFNSELVKGNLRKAFMGKQINLFALECVASYSDASAAGVGKQVCPPESLDQYSTALYAAPAIAHIIDSFHNNYVKINYHVIFGDDDFIYSVDAPWQQSQPHVAAAINKQKDILQQVLPGEYHLAEGDMLTIKEFSTLETQGIRAAIMDYITTNQLTGPIQGRLQSFIDWRKTISVGHLLTENHLVELANNELTSFAVQGFVTPLLFANSNVPIINLNTFPGYEFADDLCMRLGIQKVGLHGVDFGTIHPSPIFMEKKQANLLGKDPQKIGRVFTCGDPKGNPHY